MVLSLISVPVVARALGPSGRGLSAAMLATISIVQVVAAMGVPLAVRRRVATGDRMADVMATSRVYALLTVFPVAILAFAVDRLLFAEYPLTARIAYYVSMVLVPLSVSWAADVSVLVAMREYGRMALLGMLQSLASFVLVVLIWTFGYLTVASVLYASAAGNVITFLVGIAWVRSTSGHVRGLRSLAREGASLVGGQMADIASKRVDQILVLPLLGATGAGLYSVAVTIASLSVPITQSLGAGAFNDLTRQNANATLRVVRYSSALSSVSAITLGFISYFFIPIIFGSDFGPAIPVAITALVGSTFVSVGFVCSMALAAQMKGRSMTIAQLVGAVVGLALIYPLGRAYGSVGAAAAMAAGALVAVVLLLRLLKIPIVRTIPTLRDLIDAIHLLVGSSRLP